MINSLHYWHPLIPSKFVYRYIFLNGVNEQSLDKAFNYARDLIEIKSFKSINYSFHTTKILSGGNIDSLVEIHGTLYERERLAEILSLYRIGSHLN